MNELKSKLQDFTFKRGQYADCGLKVDYGVWLAKQEGFALFNELFCQVKAVYRCGEADDELHQLVTAFVNSLFWDYGDSEAIGESVLVKMVDRFYVDQLVYRQLAKIADCYKLRRLKYSPEKVILMQSLASLADFGQTDKFPYLYSLVPFLLIRELTEWVDDIFKFETEQMDTTNVRGMVKKVLYYLSQEQKDGRIITTEQYACLEREIVYMITCQRLPDEISPIELVKKGSLESGYSWMFLTYGIGLLFRKNQLPRDLWIAYLERKIAKSRVSLTKKLTVRPDSWNEKIIRE